MIMRKRDRRKERKYYTKKVRSRTNNENILSSSERKAIRAFWDRYKVNVSPIFHAFYKEKTGQFNVNYIPDDVYYEYIDRYYNNWAMSKYVDNKCDYDLMFSEANQPALVAKRINGYWLSQNTILDEANAREKILSNDRLVIKKATDSCGGSGVYFWQNGEDIDDILTKIDGDMVIQEVLEQSAELAKLNRSSVNTIRMITMLNDHRPEVVSSIVRMGINESRVDNATAGGITCGMNDSGQLNNCAYSAAGIRYDSHPNGTNFGSVVVPSLSRAKEMVKNLQCKLPYFRLISWDIAMSNTNDPVLIEMNLRRGQLDIHQLNNGPIFGNDPEHILDCVFTKTPPT